MKLIRTKLLKNGHASDAAIATASHLDYCQYRYKRTLEEFTYKNIFTNFVSIGTLIFTNIVALFVRLTHGIILYPLWIVYHIQIKKELIDFHGIDKLNEGAEKYKLEDD